MRESPRFVISSGARDLAFSVTYEEKISRLRLEMTIATQSLRREEELRFAANSRQIQPVIAAPHPSCPVWIAGVYCSKARKDASGDIRVSLGSGTPCRNDDTLANTKHPSRDLARYDIHVGFCFRADSFDFEGRAW